MSSKKSLRDRIKEHVAESATDDLDSTAVPEFGAQVYFQKLTAGDIARIQRRHPTFLSGSGDGFGVEAMVDLIVLKALDEEGDKLFNAEDKMWLRKRSYETLAMLGGAIVGSSMSVEEHEGN